MKGLKIYKSIVASVFILVIFCVTPVSAYADLIWEPKDNFYEKNFDKCRNESRYYFANGKDGYISLMREPSSKDVVAQIENGKIFYVSFTYTSENNEVWGVIQFEYDENKQPMNTWRYDESMSGWVPMRELLLKYDNESFISEHKSELQEYKGEFDDYTPDGKVILWTFPCSGEKAGAIEEFPETPNFSYTYTDADGKLWGYIGYFYGHRGWINISEPTSESHSVTAITYEGIIPPSAPAKASGGFSATTLLIVLVVFAVGITAVLIRVFWKRKQDK